MAEIDPILPDDSELAKFRKTGYNLGVHAWNGLRSVTTSRNPIAAALIVGNTPTEELARDYGWEDKAGQTLTKDLSLRTLGVANRMFYGAPGLATRALQNWGQTTASLRANAAQLGSALREHFSSLRQAPPQNDLTMRVNGALPASNPEEAEQRRLESESAGQGLVRG